MCCKNCGGDMLGDGYSEVRHCENVDVIGEGYEPDANPVFCEPDAPEPTFVEALGATKESIGRFKEFLSKPIE